MQYKYGKNHRLFYCIRCKELNAQFEKDSKRRIPFIKIVNDFIMGWDPDFPAYDHFCFDSQINIAKKIAVKIPDKNQYRVPSAKSESYYVFDYSYRSTYICSDCLKVYNYCKKDQDKKKYKLKYIQISDHGVIDGDVDEGHICGDIDTEYVVVNNKRYIRNGKNGDYGKAIFLNNKQTRVITTSKLFHGKKFVWTSYKKTPKYTLFKCFDCKRLTKNKVPFIKVMDGKLIEYNPDFPIHDHVCISNNLYQTADMDIKLKNSCKSKDCRSPIRMITDITRQQATTSIKKTRKRIKKELIESVEMKEQKRNAKEEVLDKKEKEDEVKLLSQKIQETFSLTSAILNHNTEKEDMLRQHEENSI
uniref:Uncharacterized protein n=1 Tax=Acrobeloides nanus TaxID=290746 RepID=A0A914CEV1_9BILA